MLIRIDNNSGIPVFRQIMDQIRTMIITGRLGTGEQLESVRELSARLKVNPMTVSKVYGYLEKEDLIERRRGIGLFVAPLKKETGSRIKERIFREEAKKTAALAIQLGISEEEACSRLREQFKNIKPKKMRNVG